MLYAETLYCDDRVTHRWETNMSAYDPDAAASVLTDLAARHGYSLRHLGRLAGIHDRTVSNYAAGGRQGRSLRRPDPEKWLRLGVVFGPDDGAKLMETCGLGVFAEALRRFTIEDDDIGGLEFLPPFQQERVRHIILDVMNRAKGLSVNSTSGSIPQSGLRLVAA